MTRKVDDFMLGLLLGVILVLLAQSAVGYIRRVPTVVTGRLV